MGCGGPGDESDAGPRREGRRIAALDTAADYLLARGVTWVQDAWVEAADVETYVAARIRCACAFNLALYADPRYFDSQARQFAESRRRVEAAGSPLLTANTVKFFADGVVENETGALLEPYCSGLHNHGQRNWEGDALARAAAKVDELGLQIHIHAIGDAAVRQALDAIEFVIQRNGIRDRRPVIAHAQLVDDADIGRFAELGAIPNMQPLWAQMDALMTVLTIPRLGAERADRQYRMASLLASGARTCARLGLAGVLRGAAGRHRGGNLAAHLRRPTRRRLDPGGDRAHRARAVGLHRGGGLSGVRRIALGHDHRRRQRDLVWLDRDPRATPALELPALTVRATICTADRPTSRTERRAMTTPTIRPFPDRR